MNIPLFDILSRLSFPILGALLLFGMCLFYLTINKKVHWLFFFLTLGGAFVGSSIPLLADLSSLSRWIMLFLLLVSGLIFSRIKISTGMLFFIGYAFVGFVAVLSAKDIIWQAQRGILLLIVSISIAIAYGDKSLSIYKLSFSAIAVAATLFSVYGFIPLQSQLSFGSRYFENFKAAPYFAMTLGGVLPFTYWGLWKGDTKFFRLFCCVGFVLGVVTLFFSGQRAGTIAGFLGLIPLLLTTFKKREHRVAIFILPVVFLVIVAFTQFAGSEKINFLVSRYSLDINLSNREFIWDRALSEISKNPFWGQGIGASETVISSSFHNTYLEVWFNSGILGLLLYLFAQFYFLYRIILLWQINQDADLKSLLALGAGYMGGFIALCMVESVGASASTLNLLLYIFIGAFVSNDGLFKKIKELKNAH